MRVVHSQEGDTIIEVMLAFTVFAMLAVGSIAIMNRGVASAQEALETTLVREQIDGQAETLRFLHQAYMANSNAAGAAAVFKDIRTANTATDAAAQPTPFNNDNGCLTEIPRIAGVDSFALNPRTGSKIASSSLRPMSLSTNIAYAQVVTSPSVVSNGIWIEAIEGGESNQPKFIDFHIRGCWYSLTSEAPRTLGTIVRLYVPA